MSSEEYVDASAVWLCRQMDGLGLTLAEVAEAIDVSPSTLSNWRRAKHEMPASRKAALNAYFKTKWAESEMRREAQKGAR